MNGDDKNKNPLNPKGETPKTNKNLALILILIMLGGFFIFLYNSKDTRSSEISIPFSTLLNLIKASKDNKDKKENKIIWNNFVIVEREIRGKVLIPPGVESYKPFRNELIGLKTKQNIKQEGDEYRFNSFSPAIIDYDIVKLLIEAEINFKGEPQSSNFFGSLFLQIIPWILIFGVLWFIMFRQIQGTGNKAMSFGKSKAKLAKPNNRKITFKDVAGVDEAKEELKETVEFLREPGKFKKLGAKIPKGVLLVGPPGTGKTLLARSVAGEANRPFFSMSGSEFVEMFVGVGASRVRDLFDQGKKNAPCILFIDELDAVGRTRGAGYGGGHDEREQTLNQMLVEMDGFDTDETVIIMAATNRPDVLDPALLRPGRFDRRVVVSRPDIRGREEILAIHMEKIPCAKSVDKHTIARGTPGFSGADLANLVNEAALIAARREKKKVQMDDFEYAKDKVLMGPERKSMVISDKEKLFTAYHEAGHALLAFLLLNSNPIHKVSIIPRGQALGITQTLPEDDRYTYSKEYCLEEIMVLFGGRICEEYKFGKSGISNGASNDIEKVTLIAHSMVCEWGMSDKLGPITYGQKEEPIFLGKEIARHKDYSEKTAELIDLEIKTIVESCYDKAKKLIMDNIEKLEKLAQTLLEREVLDRSEIEVLLNEG